MYNIKWSFGSCHWVWNNLQPKLFHDICSALNKNKTFSFCFLIRNSINRQSKSSVRWFCVESNIFTFLRFDKQTVWQWLRSANALLQWSQILVTSETWQVHQTGHQKKHKIMRKLSHNIFYCPSNDSKHLKFFQIYYLIKSATL